MEAASSHGSTAGPRPLLCVFFQRYDHDGVLHTARGWPDDLSIAFDDIPHCAG